VLWLRGGSPTLALGVCGLITRNSQINIIKVTLRSSQTEIKTKNELAEKCGGRGEERGKDVERPESLSKEQNPLALLRRGPRLWKRAIGSYEM
jgi:hypothetical protein